MSQKINQSPSCEPGEMRCSDLDVPLLTVEDIGMIKNYLCHLSYEQWTVLDSDAICLDAAQLCKMCQIVIRDISVLVLKNIEFQVLSKPHVHVPNDDKGTTSKSLNGEPLLDGCSYCRVTEDDIQATLDHVLEKCFGLALGLKQKRSYESDRLCTLFSAEIAKNVNSALRNITGSTSLQSDEFISPSNLKEMVGHVINILITCRNSQIYPEVQKSERHSSKTDTISYTTQQSHDLLDFLDSLNFGALDSEEDQHVQTTKVKGFQQDRAKTFSITPSTTKSTDSLRCLPARTAPSGGKTVQTCTSPSGGVLASQDLLKCSDDELFLTTCITKLVIHIANKTHTAPANLDFYQIATQLKDRIVDEQRYTMLQNSTNLHITIYKELCCKFRSKYVLLGVMEMNDVAFVEALAEMLKAELKKLTEKKSSKSLWRIFRRSNKVSPVRLNKALESHSEEHKQRNGSTPSHQNKEGSRNTSTFSSMFTCLRKAFTCCITSQD
ncbi:uncharacterized protein LOC115789273 [Archocentrus centrarchus]|uniref:uncharacterized protein LOC115789273 n=1 Tax=Archocentrus centrarchus TaxID=63155 RepID=UPI0011EA0EDB|nr:uncharacterized protein LOC115789273 [Archocentrus centrarchus]